MTESESCDSNERKQLLLKSLVAEFTKRSEKRKQFNQVRSVAIAGALIAILAVWLRVDKGQADRPLLQPHNSIAIDSDSNPQTASKTIDDKLDAPNLIRVHLTIDRSTRKLNEFDFQIIDDRQSMELHQKSALPGIAVVANGKFKIISTDIK